MPVGSQGSRKALREELDIHSVFTWEKFLREGVDAHFNARKNALDWTESLAKASDYWEQTLYGTAQVLLGRVRCPATLNSVSLYTKQAFKYPLFSVDTQLPDLIGAINYSQVWFGLENGSHQGNGTACFRYGTYNSGVSETLHLCVGGDFGCSLFDITSLLPATYKTARNLYTIAVYKNLVVFSINRAVVGVCVNTTNLGFTNINPPPYGLFKPYARYSPVMTALVEVQGRGAQLDFPIDPWGFRVSDGDPLSPDVYRLYNAGTTTLWAGMAVTNAVTVTSHPFPLFGYSGKTIDFQATVAGTLFIDVLTQTNNWRVYPPNAGTAITANVLENFPISGDEVLARLRFTPAANGTISDAEVHLR